MVSQRMGKLYEEWAERQRTDFKPCVIAQGQRTGAAIGVGRTCRSCADVLP